MFYRIVTTFWKLCRDMLQSKFKGLESSALLLYLHIRNRFDRNSANNIEVSPKMLLEVTALHVPGGRDRPKLIFSLPSYDAKRITMIKCKYCSL